MIDSFGFFTISTQDLAIVGLLVFLEGILSIDNALVLAMLARGLPQDQQKKALTYGLVGAVVFRLIALGIATYLMQWRWVKFVGGGYLLFLSGKHFYHLWTKEDSAKENVSKSKKLRGFWSTVVLIELTDIAFAVDSILAAIALTPKYWIVVTGGVLGIVMMRFSASMFIRLLNRFPNFENTAYFLVTIIGVKVILEGLALPGVNFHSPSSISFWVFWGLMVVSIGVGFFKLPPSTSAGP
jgi:YkoY family integral membrane protein